VSGGSGRPGPRPSGLRVGQTYRDATGRVSVVVLVLDADVRSGRLCLDGVPMVPVRPQPCSTDMPVMPGATLRAGERYRDAIGGVEVRCLSSGPGVLSFAGRELTRVAPA
jgi:hypothetical protein